MDDLLYDPADDFLDDTGRLLSELESQIENSMQTGHDMLRDFGFMDPYVAPEPEPYIHPSPYDYSPDGDGLLLDMIEAAQESMGERRGENVGDVVPQPQGHGGMDAYEPLEPPPPIYGSFEREPPPMPETDVAGESWRPPGPMERSHRIGRSTGSRASHTGEGGGGRTKEAQYWCMKKGEPVSALTDDCKDCEEDCDYAGGGFEAQDTKSHE